MIYTFKQFKKEFPDDNACLDYIFKARYSGYKCPKCGKTGFYRIKNRKSYACRCGYQIHPVSNTIFHKSDTKLTNWFFAIYLMSQSKHGISAKELQRHLGTTYKTAWRIAKLIRSLMKQDDKMLNNKVEIDEVYIGGRRKVADKIKNKAMIIGMVQRGGKLKAQYLEEYWTPAVLKEVMKNVERGTYLITDDSSIYKKTKRLGYFHKSIKHCKKKYVFGDIHTNTIEGFWSQVKNSLKSTYKSVSHKHLQSYIDELTYHYNSRLSSVSVFESLLYRLCELPEKGLHKSVLFEMKVFS